MYVLLHMFIVRRYVLTHEIFAQFQYGYVEIAPERGYPSLINRLYLAKTLPPLVKHYSSANGVDPDLLGELLECMRFLGLTDVPEYVFPL